MVKQLKSKGGRPKEKVEDKIDLLQVRKLAGYNLTDVEIADVLGICERTLNNYKKDPGFLAALKRGKVQADSRVIESLYKRATGYKFLEKTIEGIMGPGGTRLTAMQKVKTVVKHVEPNVAACIFWLKNRRPQDWREMKEGAGVPGDAVLSPAQERAIIADAEKRATEGSQVCH